LDTFTRPEPTTDLGSSWNETVGDDVNGDWDIIIDPNDQFNMMLHEVYGEEVGEGGTADSILFCTVSAQSEGEMFITVEVHYHSIGDKFRLYPCCPDASHIGSTIAEFTRLSGNGGKDWSIELGGETATVTVKNINADDPVSISVCVDHSIRMARAHIIGTNQDGIWLDDYDPGDGSYAAIGHDNTSTGAVFDDFIMGQIKTRSENCTECFCYCQDQSIPKKVHCKITEVYDFQHTRASCLNGVEWEMDWLLGGVVSYWEGAFTHDTEESPPVPVTVSFRLGCGTYGSHPNGDIGDTVQLEWMSPFVCGGSGPVFRPIEEESTCDPLSLVFGPFSISYVTCPLCAGQDLPAACWAANPPPELQYPCYGSYYITITE
jgi:hypothetical protein